MEPDTHGIGAMSEADFVKVRSGDLWSWRWRGWTSPAFPYLEDRPWTPTVIGGQPCFVAANNALLDEPSRHTPLLGAKWCIVWGDRRGPWFEDVSNLSDFGGRPIYIARESNGTASLYVVVWGDKRSQDFGHQIVYEIAGNVVMVRRFDPRGSVTATAECAIWQDIFLAEAGGDRRNV